MQIDHLVYAAPDLDAAVRDVAERFGVQAVAGGRHLGLGTHNALLALGSQTYLEIIAPDPAQPEPSMPRAFGVDGVSHGALVGWALASRDIERAAADARARGYDPGDVIDAQREGPAGNVLRWRLTLNAISGGLVPFLISWGDTEHPARSAPQGLTLESLHVEHPDPSSIAALLAAIGADVDVTQAPAPALAARIGGPNGSIELR